MVAAAGKIAPKRTRSRTDSVQVLYGIHSVHEALRAERRRIETVYIVRQGDKTLQPIEERAVSRRIPLQRVSADELARLSGSRQHQGVGARVGPYPLQPLAAVESATQLSASRRALVVLDNIVDPHNLGAVVRTALAVNAAAVIIPKDRAAGPTPAVSRASAGALEHTTLIQVTNLSASLKLLKEGGWWIYGLDRFGSRSVYDVDLTVPIVMVLGSEGRGIRPLVKKQCDRLVFIPQSGPVASLNASVAAAVFLYEVQRQRT